MRAWQGLLPAATAALLLISTGAGPAPVTLEQRVIGCQNNGGAVSECITTAAAAAGIPPCETEDAPGPCRWDAAAAGDGAGSSFTVLESGAVLYDDGGAGRIIPPYCSETLWAGPCLQLPGPDSLGYVLDGSGRVTDLVLGA